MKRRILGRTGLSVSEISLGTVEIGLDYGIPVHGDHGRPDESSAAKLLHQTLDWGVNFIDTARLYGEAEAIIGRALKSRRHEFVLTSKVTSFQDQELTSAARKEKIKETVHESLRLLQTDTIDILMIHSAPTQVILQGEVLQALQELRQEGHIRFTGVSVYGNESAMAAIDDGGYDCMQIAYNALDRRPERGVLAAAAEKGVGIVARSVLLKGALTFRRDHLPSGLDPLKRAVDRIEAIAGGTVESLPELAYRYVLASDPPHSALVGTGSIGELKASIEFADKGPLDAAVLEQIRSMPMLEEHFLNPGTWPKM
ncbi:MAG: aldo/keto reductase [Bryobacteraceae bacterium]